ncbi:MAG TPA: glycoside hydrolase family 43 C-terminal domain-containing protein [Abditibacteriaceae bacterium]|jgi:arabinan endo-1,5-alpha-L-arabinosidase
MSKCRRRNILTTSVAISLMISCGLACATSTPAKDMAAVQTVPSRQRSRAVSQEPRAPVFRDAAVHDPSVIKVGDTFYVFGSHLAAAKTRDFMQWDMVASDINYARIGDPAQPNPNRLFDNILEELKEAFAWTQSRALWATDVIQLKDGRFYMYYNVTKGNAPRSALGVAVADKVEGPYKNLGILLKSGMWQELGEDGTGYNARRHPNAVDPDTFYDNDGQLWMIYGSFSGGLFILKMDETTGKQLPGQGYGKRLIGGNHSPIEGGYILYHPQTRFYYMFASFGGLDAASGYNIRVARSTGPDGPYFDAEGNDMADVQSDPRKPLFDNLSIEPYGVKLMGNFLFERKVGDPGSGLGIGYVSPGHNSAYYDPATGKMFLIFHARFPQRGEAHQLRVHQMFMNQNDWPVVAPYRYAGETAGTIRRQDVAGEYKYVNHGKAISKEIHKSQYIRLEQDGRITGAVNGTWKTAGDNSIAITVGDQLFDGVAVRQWEPDSQSYVLTFSALSKQGVAIWGSKIPDKTPAQIVADVQRALTLGDTRSSVITNLSLPTEGTRQSRITWVSSNQKVVSNEGAVTRPEVGAGNARAILTATITLGAATATKAFSITVKEKSAGGLVAHYAFDGNLKDSTGRAANGSIVGNRINNTGGKITFATGVRGNAAVFDGASGILLPRGMLSGNEYSVALWVKPAQLTEITTTFFGARDRDNWVSVVPMGLGFLNNETMVWAGSASWYDALTKMKIPVNVWTHLSFAVRDGAITVYVNGAPQFSGTNFPNVFTTTTGTFALGVNWQDVPFKGLMDELRVYESALTAEEIVALAQNAPQQSAPQKGDA